MNKKTLLFVLAAIVLIAIAVIALTANGKKAPEAQEAPDAVPTETPKPTPEAAKPAEVKETPKPTPPRPTLDVRVEKDEVNGSGVEEVAEGEMEGSGTLIVNPVSVAPASGELSYEPQTEPAQDDTTPMSYAAYCAMSAEEQYAFMQSFESPEAFLNWYNAAKAAYDASNPVHVLQPGDVIDLGQ